MAVEGAHDSNIYISESNPASVTSFNYSNSVYYKSAATADSDGKNSWVSNEGPMITWGSSQLPYKTWMWSTNGASFSISDADTAYPWLNLDGTVRLQYTNLQPAVIRKLNSIQNISFNQDVQETPALVVGQEISPTQIDGPTQTTVSVDKILNNNDFIRTLAGLSNISGQFEYGDNLLSFNRTCLNNFSVSATINQLPQASFDFTIYGSLSGTSNSVSSSASNDDAIEEITPEGLLVTFDKQSINAVQSFNYSEVFNKKATYGIGSNEPSDIQTVGPVIQEASIAIEVEDYEPEETFSFLSGSKDRNRTIKMEISGENSILNTFQLENGHLVSENVGVGVGGTIVANLKYRGYKKV